MGLNSQGNQAGQGPSFSSAEFVKWSAGFNAKAQRREDAEREGVDCFEGDEVMSLKFLLLLKEESESEVTPALTPTLSPKRG